MIKLIDFILNLFCDEDHAQAFVTNPDQALADAGFSNVTSAQLQSVAATAVPSLAMGGDGDAVAGLQQAVSGYWAPSAAPIGPDLASDNSFLSPTNNIQDDHGLSVGLGDLRARHVDPRDHPPRHRAGRPPRFLTPQIGAAPLESRSWLTARMSDTPATSPSVTARPRGYGTETIPAESSASPIGSR